MRLGRLPLDSYQKLSFYAGKPFIFKSFDAEKDYRWGAYFCMAEDAPEIDDIFSSLYFERMRVPAFIHGTPETALTRLREEIATNREQLAAAKTSSRSWWTRSGTATTSSTPAEIPL